MSADDIRDARAALIESLRADDRRARSPTTPSGRSTRASARSRACRRTRDTETYFQLRTRMTRPAVGRRAGDDGVRQADGRGVQAHRRDLPPSRTRACATASEHHTNKVVFTLEPNDRIEIVFYAKKPGLRGRGRGAHASRSSSTRRPRRPSTSRSTRSSCTTRFAGDQTLFVSTREVDAGWRFIDPIVDGWEAGLVAARVLRSPTPTTSSRAPTRRLPAKARRGRGRACAGSARWGRGSRATSLDSGWRSWAGTARTQWRRAMAAEGLVAAETLRDLVASARAAARDLADGAGGRARRRAAVRRRRRRCRGLAELLAPATPSSTAATRYYRDAAPRAERLAELGIHFLDCGTSGGPAGARNGACLMIGGDRDGRSSRSSRCSPTSRRPAATGSSTGHGAGHFVKMVHNGIEYGMMQAIAEGFEVLHAWPFDLDLEQVADLYQHRSVVESRLVGWLARGVRGAGRRPRGRERRRRPHRRGRVDDRGGRPSSASQCRSSRSRSAACRLGREPALRRQGADGAARRLRGSRSRAGRRAAALAAARQLAHVFHCSGTRGRCRKAL